MADNILDDVDEILGVSDEDKNFNESELQDIMSEIEDLEKEFVAVEVAPASTPLSLQEKIDAELAMELEEIATAEIVTEEVSEEITDDEFTAMDEEVAPAAEVLAFEKPAATPVVAVAPAPVSTSKSEVSFAAHGQMTLNLDFMVGSETAKLSVDPVKGLMVTLSGVELCINEDSGCTVSMENGMKFTIPLASSAVSSKKKSA